MIEWKDSSPVVKVLENEYKRLLGFPADYMLEGRVRELADWAKQWYADNGRPWIYAREVELELTADGDVRLGRTKFVAERLRALLNDAQADRAVLVAVSAGGECEARARELWLEGKPDEYFFLEVFGSAVVEHLVTHTGARICAWAEDDAMAVLPRFDERGGLLIERRASVGFGKIAIGFEDCAKRTDVAENVAGPFAERLSCDANACLIDLAQILGVTMTLEHERTAAKSIRDEAISAGFNVSALNGENAFGMSHVPHFTAIALFETSEHQLRAHCAVADETAFKDSFLERFFHS
jgi:hypothetical protein